MSKSIPVVGFDPSMRNWGIAKALLVPPGIGSLPSVDLYSVDVICPVLPQGKQVRQNSEDLARAQQLTEGAIAAAKGAKAIFVEVPVGSKSARAMASYGICVGVLGALRAMGIPFFEVTPTEVKLAGPGKKTASKQDMINWATAAFPDVPWPTYKENGHLLISEAKAEHCADATAAIFAGVSSTSFQQVLPFLLGKD